MMRTRSGFIAAFIVLYVCLLSRIKRQRPRLAPSGHAKRAQKGGAQRPSAGSAGGADADPRRQECKADIASQLSQGTVQS
jgi:hypothetical protein